MRLDFLADGRVCPTRVHELVTLLFPHLTALHCFAMRFDMQPKLLRMRLPFFDGITELVLRDCSFNGSLLSLLDLVWACPNLLFLDMEGTTFWPWEKNAVPSNTARVQCSTLRAICKTRRACQRLASMRTGYFFEGPSAPFSGSVFGSALTEPRIDDIDLNRADLLTTFLRGSFLNLSFINVTMRYDKTRSPNEPGLLPIIASSLGTPRALKKATLGKAATSSCFSSMHEKDARRYCRQLAAAHGTALENSRPLNELLIGLEELTFTLDKEHIAHKPKMPDQHCTDTTGPIRRPRKINSAHATKGYSRVGFNSRIFKRSTATNATPSRGSLFPLVRVTGRAS
ncbi:hypothetical protein VTO73DRAFT_7770 [Trametes versicolor]